MKNSAKPYENSKFILVDNVNLHVRIFHGEKIKKKILLLHGFGSHTYAWRNNIPELISEGICCVCVDVPPWGYSDKQVFDQKRLSFILFELLKELDKRNKELSAIEKWILCGHSMGGVIVINMASEDCSGVEKIILLNPALKPPYPKFLLMMAKPFTTFSYNLILKLKPLHVIAKRPYNGSITTDEIHNIFRPFYEDGVPKVLGSVYNEGFKFILSQDVKDNIKKLVIWSDKDNVLGKKHPDIINHFKNCNLHIIKDCGHCSMETHYKEVNRIILNYIF